MKNVRGQRGVTIFELLLVMAIAGSIIMLGISQYTLFRQRAEISQVQFNIETLFQAMNHYYLAHCEDDSIFKIGPPNKPVQIKVSNLRNEGFLADDALIVVPNYVNPDEDTAYPMQFNPAEQDKIIDGENLGKVYLWTFQIGLRLADGKRSTNAQSITNAKLLGADCIVDFNNGSGNPTGVGLGKCISINANVSRYPSWERAPSMSNAAVRKTGSWLMTPLIRQFIDQNRNTLPYRCGG